MRQLETDRLIVRGFLQTDWEDLYEYLSNPEVVKFEPYDIFSEEDCIREAEERWEEGDNGRFWAVCLKENNKMIGHIYFCREEPLEFIAWDLGYVFNPNYYGKGYATEACKGIVKYGFEELKARRIVAEADVKNSASWKLLERLEMRREAHKLQNVFFRRTEDGKPIWKDSYSYALLNTEWNSKL